jgi:hypothetical protein
MKITLYCDIYPWTNPVTQPITATNQPAPRLEGTDSKRYAVTFEVADPAEADICVEGNAQEANGGAHAR